MRKLDENFNAMKKRLMQELLTGKRSAIQLQKLEYNTVKDEGSISREELAMKILRSFDEGLSIVSSCTGVSALVAAVDRGGGGGGSASSCQRKKKLAKDKRGCYKRKRTSDSWTRQSHTKEDGFGWRKYGQKSILDSDYPRCYYRCTHKSQGCNATKQVQKIKEDPLMYQTTYFNHHTCTDTQVMLPHHVIESDPSDQPNLLSFQPSKHILSPKQGFDEDKKRVGLSCAKPFVDRGSRRGITGSGSPLCNQVWSPKILVSGDGDGDLEEEVSGLYSCGSMNGFHGFDTEVNQLGDIEYFDEIYNGKIM